ncbi:surface protein [Streptomyces candidus]|uniref:Uncharacterized protein n=1 Tax=Streptomyces candidus TaxID=67283 RepID=A0A7X0HHY5_9ACTN|nr:surface protein [Streptomyces candidus]MBB6436672.1 hypothetical protein [Streptomyces candidus]GHH51006.1 hypothetical protein GCM10018773_48850 [Streptomyces candidus]
MAAILECEPSEPGWREIGALVPLPPLLLLAGDPDDDNEPHICRGID